MTSARTTPSQGDVVIACQTPCHIACRIWPAVTCFGAGGAGGVGGGADRAAPDDRAAPAGQRSLDQLACTIQPLHVPTDRPDSPNLSTPTYDNPSSPRHTTRTPPPRYPTLLAS